MKIVHLFDAGSRYPQMINQGLIAHPDISAAVNKDVVSFGEVVLSRTNDLQLEGALTEADLIFRSGDEHFHHPEIDKILYKHSLWYRVVYYDFADSINLNSQRYKQCKLYVKRTWDMGTGKKVLQLPYCILDGYLLYPLNYKEKDIDLVYLFNPKPKAINELGRLKVYNVLSQMNWRGKKVILGSQLSENQNGRRFTIEPLSSSYENYLDILHRAKIVWTCEPDHPGGDSRLWEAFASGAMVITDNNLNGKAPCLSFKPNSKSILETYYNMLDMLDNDDWKTIGRGGYEWALTHHRPLNRIETVLEYLKR